ncbi:MAG: hypothetical protein NXY57DRAFT_988678 [Lentinula lateritia]|nr:MAG: hypothetical protein NXY57DRAFT_988678 [Lentinula lateritia]
MGILGYTGPLVRGEMFRQQSQCQIRQDDGLEGSGAFRIYQGIPDLRYCLAPSPRAPGKGKHSVLLVTNGLELNKKHTWIVLLNIASWASHDESISSFVLSASFLSSTREFPSSVICVFNCETLSSTRMISTLVLFNLPLICLVRHACFLLKLANKKLPIHVVVSRTTVQSKWGEFGGLEGGKGTINPGIFRSQQLSGNNQEQGGFASKAV